MGARHFELADSKFQLFYVLREIPVQNIAGNDRDLAGGGQIPIRVSEYREKGSKPYLPTSRQGFSITNWDDIDMLEGVLPKLQPEERNSVRALVEQCSAQLAPAAQSFAIR